MVSVTLILNGSPQNIVRRDKITAPRRPIDIRISADYSIFENGAQKIDCYVGCVASDPILLKPNVVHVILFNFWKQKFVEHGMVTLAIDRNGGYLLIFEEKSLISIIQWESPQSRVPNWRLSRHIYLDWLQRMLR